MPKPSHVLWEDAKSTIVIIDVPGSIEDAQRLGNTTSRRRLLSSAPLTAPFPTNEAKSPAKQAKLEKQTGDVEIGYHYRILLQNAIETARQHLSGNYCLPRRFVVESAESGAKRKLYVDSFASHQGPLKQRQDQAPVYAPRRAREEIADDLNHIAREVGALYQIVSSPAKTVEDHIHLENYQTFEHHLSNTKATEALLYLRRSPLHERVAKYHLPAHTSFCLSDCANSELFHQATQDFPHQDETTTQKYNFILLDPPWPNRSVRRTHKSPGSTTYAISPTLAELQDLLTGMNLEALMSENCLVGIWITNNASVRASVLDPEHGVFARWNVELVEEWVWLKTTVHGEPIVPLDSLWRKPYEVFLLGRRGRSCDHERRESSPSIAGGIRHRVIIGVPDLHSRKPCLKFLIEPLLPSEYRALEVFARYLVAGWHSWGYECLKFNSTEYWRVEDPEDGHKAQTA